MWECRTSSAKCQLVRKLHTNLPDTLVTLNNALNLIQTLLLPSPMLSTLSRCSETPLELGEVLSDSARAFSGAPETTCSYGGAFRMLQDLTYRVVKFWSSWDLYAGPWETSRAGQTSAPISWRLGALFSQVVVLSVPQLQVISFIIFLFVSHKIRYIIIWHELSKSLYTYIQRYRDNGDRPNNREDIFCRPQGR